MVFDSLHLEAHDSHVFNKSKPHEFKIWENSDGRYIKRQQMNILVNSRSPRLLKHKGYLLLNGLEKRRMNFGQLSAMSQFIMPLILGKAKFTCNLSRREGIN